MPHSSDSSDSSFSRSPPPGKQVESPFPPFSRLVLPGDTQRGTGFLILPRLPSSKGVAGGMSSLLDLRPGICNQAEPVGRDPNPPAHSAEAPTLPAVPVSPGFPPQEAF